MHVLHEHPPFSGGAVGLVGVAYNRAYNAARAEQLVADGFRV